MLSSLLVTAIAVGIHAWLVAPLPRVPLPRPAKGAPTVAINDNRAPAGARSAGVLTLALDVIESAWKPGGEKIPKFLCTRSQKQERRRRCLGH